MPTVQRESKAQLRESEAQLRESEAQLRDVAPSQHTATSVVLKQWRTVCNTT